MIRNLLKAKQVKELLGLSDPTLYRLHDSGLLRAIEISHGARKRILRWRPETIEKFISDREKSVAGR
jgi:predicted DNA-binding transcriptional regulator AlpA